MTSYKLSPYVNFIENRLFPGVIQHGVFHRLSGEVLEPGEKVRSILLAVKTVNRISLTEENLLSFGADGYQLKNLIEKEFLIPDGYDPLTPFVEQYVSRPIQNPGLTYHANNGEVLLVRTSMAHHVFSPRAGELPELIEEAISPMAAAIFKIADGTKTLREIFATLRNKDEGILDDAEFRDVLDFLTSQDRQLIKFTSQREDLDHPYKPVNIVPRDLYHSAKWNEPALNGSSDSVIDFHVEGIDDAQWEFDLIEPTVNHSFRFPNEALGGFDYGSRFAISTLRPDVVPLLSHSDHLEILEVGGGTGTFARSFLEQAQSLAEGVGSGIDLNYHILDLSPTLMQSQRKLLSEMLPVSRHFHQDATKLSIPSHRFDLIIANEVIADFPMAVVQRRFSDEAEADAHGQWQGTGAHLLEKYGLATDNAPDSFWVSAGAFDFIERCFEHLAPGGAVSVLVLNGREEHLLTLNHILQKHGTSLPYAVISKKEFEERLQTIVERIELSGFSFSPLSSGYHFGPKIDDFMTLIMTKPLD